MSDILNERTKQNFLIYANSVIKSRAIPCAEDNLKPIHRKILWTLYEDKVYDDAKKKKCATEVGRVLAYSPHGDASVYGALARMAQWWKLRYPLVEFQGNVGNLLGDGPAASRYTECRLSPVGMMMLEDIEKNCVEFKPNYDNTTTEPVILPSKFPYLLCGNNSGIAVGMGSDIVSHNFTEVSEAIKYYMEHKDCNVLDLMKFIQGPDFPTGGVILNGEELEAIYTRGTGTIKMAAHYDISKRGKQTLITFHDLPYGVEIDDGIKKPLKKLVLDEGYSVFEDIIVEKAGPRNFDITVVLGKDAKIEQCLDILWSKTKLASSIKVNNNFIVNGEPRVLGLKQMIEYWVNFRSQCIKKIAWNNYQKTNHKLTVVLGLQKCLSDVDKLVMLIRQASNRAAAKTAIKEAFALNDEQADAVLDMKLSRLSKLDITELNDDKAELEKTLAKLKETIEEESIRYEIIRKDLDDIKKVLGKDERLTEITYARPVATADRPLVKQEYIVYRDGLHADMADTNIVDVVFAYTTEDILGYCPDGTISPILTGSGGYLGALVKDNSKNKFIVVTKKGNVKVSNISEYKLTKNDEKIIKLKEDDSVIMANVCNDDDFVMIFDGERVLKLAIKDLAVAGKLTMGVKSGMVDIVAACVVNPKDNLLFVTKDLKGKYTPVQDFSTDSRGNKGQQIVENTLYMRRFDVARESIYCAPKSGKLVVIPKTKLTIKSRTALGAILTTRAIDNII